MFWREDDSQLLLLLDERLYNVCVNESVNERVNVYRNLFIYMILTVVKFIRCPT